MKVLLETGSAPGGGETLESDIDRELVGRVDVGASAGGKGTVNLLAESD